MNYPNRRRFLGAVGGLAAVTTAGCLGMVTGGDGPVPSGTPTVPRAENAGGFFSHDASVPYDYEAAAKAAVSGGVGQDGIPSIDNPTFAGPELGDTNMDPGDPVFGVVLDGQARAYPQYILVHHEIVNDELAGHNIAVTYCPLTGTAVGFNRGSDEFGVSGMLVNSNLIMFDRASESWWPQVLGSLINADESEQSLGASLQEVRVTWTTWENWQAVYPETEVLTEDTGAVRNYDRAVYGTYNPADGYYTSDEIMFDMKHVSGAHHPKEVFIGARSRDGAVAFGKDLLRGDELVTTTVGGVSYLAAYDPALDTARVYRNPEAEAFERVPEGYRGPDGETYHPASLPLEEINSFDAMWFAWYGFYPDTEVVA